MEEKIRIATRGSSLALKQFEIVSGVLRGAGIGSEAVIVKSHGEIDASTPLYRMKEQGIFVRKLNESILNGNADAAVHSAKDIPNEIDPSLNISYYSMRGDPRDYFVSRGDIRNFAGTVGSSSVRRRTFLGLYNKKLQFIDVRGNIETRIRKWESGQTDSIVIAKTALDRLGLNPKGEILSEEVCPPDPNQGFIAVVSPKNSHFDNVLKKLQGEHTLWEASTERGLMTKLLLGCNVAVSIRAVYSERLIRFSYANEERRYDFSFLGEIPTEQLPKLRDLIES